MITRELLLKISKSLINADQWVDHFNNAFVDYGMDTKEKQAAFLAQTAHESAGWTILKERLSYSKEGLMKVFPKYFNEAQAEQYARKGAMIASRVYANRMGNGDEASGDGFKYCGRGIIQLTGKQNYTLFSQDTYGDDRAVTNPEIVETVEGAIKSACWFWKKNDLNNITDFVRLTKRINGGTIGLEDRKKHYDHIMELL